LAAWSRPTRILFRFAFCLLVPYSLCCGHKTVFTRIPFAGHALEAAFERIYLVPARWIGQHLFHLTGAAAVIHPSAFADRALDWIAAGLMLACAMLATLVWSLIDELPAPRRLSYPLLFQAMRWTLRLTLVISILWYGAIKIFPIQIESPSLAVLNERVGDTSPMTMLWTLLGMNHMYERVCGTVETVAALLLLWRRTALSGAVLAVIVMANIVLFDVFFDVPVRLYATALLLMALTLIAPDAQALLRFFFTRTPSTPSTTWGLSAAPRPLRAAALVFEVVVFLSAFKPIFGVEHTQSARELANERHPAAIAGQWHIDASSPDVDPLFGGSHQPITDVFLEPSGRINERSSPDRRLWGGGVYDPATHTMTLLDAMHAPVSYTYTQPDSDHLVLKPASSEASYPTLYLTRVPLPSHYPLLDRLHERSLHLVEEWGFER
jgi:hypothetical protein